MGVMSYVGVQLLVGLAAVHAITAWCLPLAPASDDGHAHHSFASGAVLCVGASLVCALGCALPRRRRGGRAATIFCAAATLAALLVAAKALAAGLLACP
jgi:drug/metabolite transporter (DMT)-like permease